jgi:Ran GTPase-activating protein (RanGAP) involved in mRNA processing and transport
MHSKSSYGCCAAATGAFLLLLPYELLQLLLVSSDTRSIGSLACVCKKLTVATRQLVEGALQRVHNQFIEMGGRASETEIDASQYLKRYEDRPALLALRKLARARMGSLSKLTLSDYLYDDDGTGPSVAINQFIIDVLSCLKQLKYLDMHQLGTQTQFSRAITAVLSNLVQLQYIDLSKNALDNFDGRAIAAALPKLQNLQVLKLSRNHLSLDAGRAIAGVLPALRVLHHLDLSTNFFCDMSGMYIAAALPENLTYLDCSANLLGQKTCEAMAVVLNDEYRLEHLNLSNNNLGQKAGNAIAGKLSRLPALQRLNLANNKLGIQAGIAIAHALLGSTTLQGLYLDHNNMGHQLGEVIAAAMPWCTVHV